MKATILFACLLLATSVYGEIVSSYIDEKGRQIDHHLGSYTFKGPNEGLYRVNYDVEMLGGNLVINLDKTQGIKDVVCDITSVELLINFLTKEAALQFYKVISSSALDRYVTSGKWNCHEVNPSSMMLLSKVLGAELKEDVVLLHTAKGHYEEVIKDGTFDLAKVEEEPQCHSKTICFGVNSNAACNAAKSVLPILESPHMTIECTNCFIGAKATVFIIVKIASFKLRSISTGLKNINVASAFVLDMAAKSGWAGDIDKTFKIVDHAVIMQFWIGPVPVSIWFEIPLELRASAYIDAQAHATVGATANWNLGNMYVTWTESSGWVVTKPKPVFTWNHILDGDASFNSKSELSIIPSIRIHASRLAHAGIKLEPTVTAQAYGDADKKEVCADLAYRVFSEAEAELHINIPFVRVKYDRKFGPYTVFDTGVKSIGHFCNNQELLSMCGFTLIFDYRVNVELFVL
eukprot:TRINITY_DN3488_c0_g1_i1.p1 TRINITY_DN3488_c0_g1~~TRINITY_DN3488_c0_g1_i1.p1  ORF type:complete len:520 (-),score=37.77 TRINITY_DN3488_c0_g1_i1:54-1439(-)